MTSNQSLLHNHPPEHRRYAHQNSAFSLLFQHITYFPSHFILNPFPLLFIHFPSLSLHPFCLSVLPQISTANKQILRVFWMQNDITLWKIIETKLKWICRERRNELQGSLTSFGTHRKHLQSSLLASSMAVRALSCVKQLSAASGNNKGSGSCKDQSIMLLFAVDILGQTQRQNGWTCGLRESEGKGNTERRVWIGNEMRGNGCDIWRKQAERRILIGISPMFGWMVMEWGWIWYHGHPMGSSGEYPSDRGSDSVL